MNLQKPDPFTCLFELEVPPSKVVLLQAYFELYEGLATLRTVDSQKSIVCVMTTPHLLEECLSALDSIKEQMNWRYHEAAA